VNEKGIIKFNCNWIKQGPVDFELFEQMNQWRNHLFSLGLIGVTENGIGYGNISTRFSENQFIITGSGTGKIKNLTLGHYTKVTSFSLDKNLLTAQGPVIASSESLTHAALYEIDSNIQAVIHIHHEELWQELKNKVPTSDISVEYGTPAMAKEIQRLYLETDLFVKKIMIMGGHKTGIITFGSSLDKAGDILLDYYNA
jgi:L-ribulose-5-phosphate 4-epimerase